MTIREFDYAHQNTVPNPKHVESFLEFFESGIKPADAQLEFGVEIEHLPVRVKTGKAVTYAEPRGIRNVLQSLVPKYDADREY